ncbi:MAG: serine/threonine protein [Planctomycetota bacterium]|nr:MAG: serine/threonine protein [Planctomycetota bacterium]
MSDASKQVKISPDTVEGYSLKQPLGQGSTGSVFKAKRLSDGETFAIKLIFPALSKKSDFNAKFVRLAQIGGKVDHPNIVKTIASGVSNGFHYVVMEYVEGKTLESVLSRGAMDEQRALQIVLSIARALNHALDAGVVHRDVKPANILLPRGGEAKLADLGLAIMATNPKLVGGATGTPHYMSPEAARSDANIDVRSDVYSLGATLHHMLTGQTLFTFNNVAEIVAGHLSEQPKAAHKVNANVSKGASKLVQRLTEKKATDRPWPVGVISYVESLLRGDKPVDTATGRTSRGKSVETEVRISKDSPTPAMAPPVIQIPLPGRQSTPYEETISTPMPPAGKGQPGPSPAPAVPSSYPPPPGHRTPSTAYPTPPAQQPGQGPPVWPPQPPPPGPAGYPSPYPPAPQYPPSGPPPYPPQGYPPPPYGYPPQGPPPQGYPPQGYPPQGYPPQGYPPPGYPPPAAPPGQPGQPSQPPAPPPGGKPPKKGPPKGKRQIGRRWGDLI